MDQIKLQLIAKGQLCWGQDVRYFSPQPIPVLLTVGQGVALKILVKTQMQLGSLQLLPPCTRRIQLPSSRDAMRVDESSDTSMEASRQNRYRQRAPHGPNPSNSPDEDNPVDP